MSDIGRRLGFGGQRTNSGESSNSGQQNQNPEPTSPTQNPPQNPPLESRSFVRRTQARGRIPSLETNPGEHSTLLPSLLEREPASPPTNFDARRQAHVGNAQNAAAVQQQPPMSPMSPNSTEPVMAQRPGRPRLFKSSSRLSLRNNNGLGSHAGSSTASKLKKGEDGDGGSKTPDLQSPREQSPTRPWYESAIGRRASSRAASGKASGHERDQDRDRDWDRSLDLGSQYQYSSSVPTNTTMTIGPSLQHGISNASTHLASPESSPKAKQRMTPKIPEHDWKQWDREPDSHLDPFPTRGPDHKWSKPSFKQCMESLQVAAMSGESVPGVCGQSSMTPTGQPSRRRPSKPPLPSTRFANHDAPIPGQYRSDIMRAIEGMQDMMQTLDEYKTKLDEAQKAHARDLKQFTDLCKEWAEREKQFEAEMKRLQDALAKTDIADAGHRQPQGGRFKSHHRVEKVFGAGPETDDSTVTARPDVSSSFHDRASKAIQASSRMIQMASFTEPSPGVDEDTSNKKPSRPALILDLDHDRLKSDELRNAAYKEALNDHENKLLRQGRPPSRNGRSVLDQAVIDNIKRRHGQGNSQAASDNHKERRSRSRAQAPARAASGQGDGHALVESGLFGATQGEQTTEEQEQQEVEDLSSSSSSEDEDLAMYEHNTRQLSLYSASGENGSQNGGTEVSLPAEHQETTNANQDPRAHQAEHTGGALIPAEPVDNDESASSQESGNSSLGGPLAPVVSTNSSVPSLERSSPHEQPNKRADSH